MRKVPRWRPDAQRRAASANKVRYAQRVAPDNKWRHQANWRRLRLSFLHENPLCKSCETKGIPRPATDIDHIKPVSDGGGKYDWHNLQSLCKSCHSKKTGAEQALKRKKKGKIS